MIPERDETDRFADDERRALVQLAIGRIFRLCSRPTQPGDLAVYEHCRGIILDLSEPVTDTRPNWARDRHRGTAGD